MSTSAAKVECLNPNTGGRMNIDKETYRLFREAIRQTMNRSQSLTYTQLIAGIKNYFHERGQVFERSVEWYGVVVKNDMEARGEIEAITEKGKKLNRLKK